MAIVAVVFVSCLVSGAVMASNANVADSCHVNTSCNGHRNNKGISNDIDLSRLSCLVRTAGIVKVFLPVQRDYKYSEVGAVGVVRGEDEACSEYGNSSATEAS